MSWLNWVDPLAGALLAMAVMPPLILLYFLKLRRRSQPIACTMLWKKSIEDLRANAPFQRLRKSILLLLQLLALAALILAIMQPQLRAGQRSGGRLIVLIDNSASMNAIDIEDGRSRLQVAKEKAKNLVDSLQSSGLFGGMNDEVMVIGFNEKAQVYSNFTSSSAQLKEAIGNIQPTDAGSRIDEALKLARAHTTVVNPDDPNALATGPPAALELFSDGRISDWAEQVKKGETLNYYPIGTASPDNVAFGTVSAERPYAQPGALQVFVSILNFNTDQVSCTIEMSVNGNVALDWIKDVPISAASVDESTGRLVPGRSNIIFGPFDQPRGATIGVRNLRNDDLETDNQAWLTTPPPRNLSVAFVEPSIEIVTDAVRGVSMVRRLDVLSEAEFGQVVEQGRRALYDVVVLGGDVTMENLPPGRYLSLGASLGIDALAAASTSPLEGFEVADWDREHPTLRYVSLDRLFVQKITPLASVERVDALVEAASGLDTVPLLVEYAGGGRSILHTTFDILDSDWIWHESFVIFMVNAIDYLSSVGDAASIDGLRPMEPLEVELPEGASDITVTTPSGETDAIVTSDPTRIAWSETSRVGVYVVQWEDTSAVNTAQDSTNAYAVNLFDEYESNLAVDPELPWGGETVGAGADAAALQTPLWPYALALCLLVLMLEWWVYHRKAHI